MQRKMIYGGKSLAVNKNTTFKYFLSKQMFIEKYVR